MSHETTDTIKQGNRWSVVTSQGQLLRGGFLTQEQADHWARVRSIREGLGIPGRENPTPGLAPRDDLERESMYLPRLTIEERLLLAARRPEDPDLPGRYWVTPETGAQLRARIPPYLLPFVLLANLPLLPGRGAPPRAAAGRRPPPRPTRLTPGEVEAYKRFVAGLGAQQRPPVYPRVDPLTALSLALTGRAPKALPPGHPGDVLSAERAAMGAEPLRTERVTIPPRLEGALRRTAPPIAARAPATPGRPITERTIPKTPLGGKPVPPEIWPAHRFWFRAPGGRRYSAPAATRDALTRAYQEYRRAAEAAGEAPMTATEWTTRAVNAIAAELLPGAQPPPVFPLRAFPRVQAPSMIWREQARREITPEEAAQPGRLARAPVEQPQTRIGRTLFGLPDEPVLLSRARAGDREALEALALRATPSLARLAVRYAPRARAGREAPFSAEDLWQLAVGTIVPEAVAKYDPVGRTAFSTYLLNAARRAFALETFRHREMMSPETFEALRQEYLSGLGTLRAIENRWLARTGELPPPEAFERGVRTGGKLFRMPAEQVRRLRAGIYMPEPRGRTAGLVTIPGEPTGELKQLLPEPVANIALRIARERLSPARRRVVDAVMAEGSVQGAARRLNMNDEAARLTYRRAVAELRKHMEELARQRPEELTRAFRKPTPEEELLETLRAERERGPREAPEAELRQWLREREGRGAAPRRPKRPEED